MVESIQPSENETRLEKLLTEVYVNLPQIENQNNPWMIQQYIILLLLQINCEASRFDGITQLSASEEWERQRREDMRRQLLGVMNSSIPMAALQDVQQMAFALQLVTVGMHKFTVLLLSSFYPVMNIQSSFFS